MLLQQINHQLSQTYNQTEEDEETAAVYIFLFIFISIMGNTALSCVRSAATPQIGASSPDHLSSVFKASLKTRRARSSFIRSAPSSTRLMNRAASPSTDQASIQYAAHTPANKAAMPSGRPPVSVLLKQTNDQNVVKTNASTTAEDYLEMNGLIVRDRPSLDNNLSINTSTASAAVDDEEAYCMSTRCTIIPNTTLQFTTVSPLSSENVSPRTVLAFLMTSNHSKDQSLDLTNAENLDKILREHQIAQAIDHSTSQERDSDSDNETDDELDYDYDAGGYQSYINPSIKRSINEYQKNVQQTYEVSTHHYVLRQPREQRQRTYRRNSF